MIFVFQGLFFFLLAQIYKFYLPQNLKTVTPKVTVMLFGWFGPKKTSYRYKKNASIRRMEDKLKILRLKAEYQKLESEVGTGKSRQAAEKIGSMTELLEEIEDFKAAVNAGNPESNPFFQLLNSPMGIMLAQKFLGLNPQDIDFKDPNQMQEVEQKVIGYAEEHPEQVKQLVDMAKKKGIITKKKDPK